MTSQIIVNELIEDDKEIVRRLLIESYRQYEPDYTDPQIWKNYLAEITASVDNPRVAKILVAKIDRKILGTLQLFHSSEKAYERPELGIFSPIIRLLAVHPAARGHGIARELLKASVNDVKKQGFTELYLHTSDKMAKAIRLYERFGFQRDLSKDFQSADIHVKCYRLDI